jgi:hypothetical protein
LKAAMKDEVVEIVKEPETPKPPSKKPKLEFVQLLANKVNGSDLINNLDQTIQFELDKYLNDLNVDVLRIFLNGGISEKVFIQGCIH